MPTMIVILVPLFGMSWVLGHVTRKTPYNHLAAAVIFVISMLNGLHYVHVFDQSIVYYQFRSLEIADYLPALSGYALGYFVAHFRGLVYAPFKAIAIAASLYAMFLPVAKEITNPLILYGAPRFVVNGVLVQRTNSTCGPCSLAVILDSYGISKSEDEIAMASRTSASGTELWYLARYARSLGFRAEFRFDNGTVFESSIIGIRLGQTGHFVAVLRVDGNEVLIHDSTSGLKTISFQDLRGRFQYSGISLLIRRA